jgi:hypothetical protein
MSTPDKSKSDKRTGALDDSTVAPGISSGRQGRNILATSNTATDKHRPVEVRP